MTAALTDAELQAIIARDAAVPECWFDPDANALDAPVYRDRRALLQENEQLRARVAELEFAATVSLGLVRKAIAGISRGQ